MESAQTFWDSLSVDQQDLYSYYSNTRLAELSSQMMSEDEQLAQLTSDEFDALVLKRYQEEFLSLSAEKLQEIQDRLNAERAEEESNNAAETQDEEPTADEKLYEDFFSEKYDEVINEVLKEDPNLKRDFDNGKPDAQDMVFDRLSERMQRRFDALSDAEKTSLRNRFGRGENDVTNENKSHDDDDNPKIDYDADE
jgi:hypothetical protein